MPPPRITPQVRFYASNGSRFTRIDDLTPRQRADLAAASLLAAAASLGLPEDAIPAVCSLAIERLLRQARGQEQRLRASPILDPHTGQRLLRPE